jgi:hypothetical protein
MHNLLPTSLLLLSAFATSCATVRIPQSGGPQDPPPRTDGRTTTPSTTTTTTTQQPQSQSTRERSDRRDVPWEFTLSGGGTNDKDFDVGNGSINASVGYYFSEYVELVGRQSTSYAEFSSPAGDQDFWNHQTRVALDLHLPLGNFVPYLGVNVGYLYGDSDFDETFTGGPEAGFKLYLQRAAFLFVGAEYQFFFDEQDTVDEAFEDGQFFYTAGLGLRF